jgi:DNA-binding protein HU-beta
MAGRAARKPPRRPFHIRAERTMNKSEFIQKVAEKTEMSRAAAARVVDAIFDAAGGAISEAVHAAGSLTIPGFGKFTRKTRAARTGRNPRTGAQIEIPERVSVAFTPGGALREQRPSGRRSAAKAGDGAAPRKRAASGGTSKTASGGGGASSAAKETGRSGAAKSGGAKSGGGKSGPAKGGAKASGGAKSGTKGGARA